MAEDADIVLYGCDVALGSEGNTFLRRLSRITGADILASSDKTGFFGDWELETAVGRVESGLIFQPAIQEVYLNTLDSGEITITPGDLPDFTGRNFYNTTFDFNRIAADDLVLFANANLDFGTLNPNSVAKFDFRDIPTEDLSVLTEAGLTLNELDSQQITDIDYTDIPAENLEILTSSGDLTFDTLASEDIDNLNFKTIPAENLQILTSSGLNFQRLEQGDFQEIDINNIPSENIQIMANGGLSLKSYSRESVLGVELNVLQDFGYLSPESLSVLSLGGEDDFGTLSDLVVANANLFAYKGDEVSLGDGLSIAEAEVLNPNDYNAINFAFNEDEIFDSAYYFDRNPDVADDANRINPYTHYFLSGGYAPEYRDPTPYFDTSFYLETYTGVAEDGINPLLHYFSSGASEGRDPHPAFDTSFYLEEYTDVAEDGINPLLHYYFTDGNELRFANETFKTLEETGEAWVVDYNISDDDFSQLKDVAKEGGGSGLFLIRLIVDGIKYVVTFEFVKDTLEISNNVQEFVTNSSQENQVLTFPENPQLTEWNDGQVLTFPQGEYTVPFGTPPFDLAEPIGLDDNAFFPKGDGFLDDILNGRFEFPAEGEEFAYFLAAGRPGNDIGDLREQAVTDLVGGTLAKDSNGQDITVFEPGASASISIDVIGPNGELILVGGPNKVTNFSKLGGILRNLKIIAEARGVEAQYYYTDNTPESVIKFTEKRLGAENVFTFPEVNVP